MGAEVKRLHEDDEVQKTKGVYEFLLCRNSDPFAGRLLNLRAFDKRDKMAVYSRQNGQTISENCQMLCKACNGKKTEKY